MARKNKDKEDSKKPVVAKLVSKKEVKHDSKKETKDIKRRREHSVYESIAPLGLPYWEYNLVTVIHDYLEGTSYTVRDLVEGYVDENGHPTGKKRK